MPNKDRIAPPPSLVPSGLPDIWTKWFRSIGDMLGVFPLKVQAFSVSNLTTTELNPARWGNVTPKDAFSSIIFVYDETGGATLAFSDGTDWRRVTDLAIVS